MRQKFKISLEKSFVYLKEKYYISISVKAREFITTLIIFNFYFSKYITLIFLIHFQSSKFHLHHSPTLKLLLRINF